MLTSSELMRRREVVEAVVREAGEAALGRFRDRRFEVETKGPQDLVSEVDRETEAAIRARLVEAFPDTGFMGEEGGGRVDGLTWVVDPIDGTSNFVRGIPFWCLSVALVEEGRPVLGVVRDPCLGETFAAHRGGGAALNGQPISVSGTRTPDSAILGIGFSFKSSVARHQEVLAHLLAERTVYRFQGAGALTLAHCAAGRIDGFWEDHMMPWDVAAGLVLIAEAGGVVSDYAEGRGWVDGNRILASAPGLAGFFSAATGIPLASA